MNKISGKEVLNTIKGSKQFVKGKSALKGNRQAKSNNFESD